MIEVCLTTLKHAKDEHSTDEEDGSITSCGKGKKREPSDRRMLVNAPHFGESDRRLCVRHLPIVSIQVDG